MTDTLDERIARLRALDEKRVPGRIEHTYLKDSADPCYDKLPTGRMIRSIRAVDEREGHSVLTHVADLGEYAHGTEVSAATGDFIAAIANEALPIIAELEAERDRLREAVRFIVERENFAFAECTIAEEIWSKCKAALDAGEGE